MKRTIFPLLIICNIFQLRNCIAFEKNRNITDQLLRTAFNGNYSLQKTVLACAQFCAYAGLNNTCNGFVFKEEESNCDLLDLNKIDRLEDNINSPGQTSQVFTDLKMRSKLPLYCNGGTDCCLAARSGSRLCQAGEGDCGRDSDCEGLLVCGQQNCEQHGGDCCTRMCTQDTPCRHGEGDCQSNDNCMKPGYNICSGNCLDRRWFPLDKYPNNTEHFGYSSNDQCCRRACMPDSQCGEGQEGCLDMEDCKIGYECIRNIERPFCTDVDECTDGREWATGLPHCGENTYCVNSVGSFECKCNPGWDVFQGGAGCVTDINECTDGTGLPYCGSNTDCTNNDGSFSCPCKVGYQNWVENSGCSDIDECGLAPTAEYCGAHAYCSNSVGSFSCLCDTGYENHKPNEGCSDIDECAIGTGQSYCGTIKGAVCFNNVGSFTCGCQDGYTNWSANTGCHEILEPGSWKLFESDFEIAVNVGKIGIFMIGGGGYACVSGHGAGSGYPKYKTRDISADGTRVLVTVGIRGYDTSHCDGGETIVRMISPTQDITVKTGGGGQNYGWSAAGAFWQTGMQNGNSLSTTFGGSGQGVPSVPFISIRAGSGGSVYAGYGGGGGGVIIDNNVGPSRNGYNEGEGYGGGGGHYFRAGLKGAAVVFVIN